MLLQCGLGPDEFNRISTCCTAKEIWDTIKLAYEGTSEVKQSRIDLLVQKYELFHMEENESIKSMFTRFTNITNELKSLEKIYRTEEQVRKILRILPKNWRPKVTAIQEENDLKTCPLNNSLGPL